LLGIPYNFPVQAQPSELTDQAAHGSAPQSHHAHLHYRLVDIGTFGGPASDLNTGNDGGFSVNIVNNQGALAGWADTATPDPYPSYCFYDCYVTHAFRWQDGVMTDLGALADGVSSQAVWISASGLIAGVSENGEIDPLISGFPENRAVLWQNGRITDLGTLPEGGYESFANAVNSGGQVVGWAENTIPDPNSLSGPGFFPTQTRAFLWEGGVMQDLGTLGSGTDAVAQFINERGQVVGYSYASSAPNTSCPSFLPLATGSFIWDKKNGMTDLGTLGGTCTIAEGLNNNGTVVGAYVNDNQIEHGFLWENGSIHDLGGTLGGNDTGAEGINDHGVIAGFAYLAGNTTFHAALWRQVGKITDLGVLRGDQCSFASSINAKTQIVGASITDECTFDDNTRAFLWEGGSIFDLNTLIPAGSALHLQWARGINDRGEIAGTGLDAEGNVHAFLLIPLIPCEEGVEGCDYSRVVDEAAATRQSPPPVMQKPTTTPRTPALYSPFNDVRRMFPGRLGSSRFVGGPQQVALSGAMAAISAPIERRQDCDAQKHRHDEPDHHRHCDCGNQCGGFCANPHLREFVGGRRELQHQRHVQTHREWDAHGRPERHRQCRWQPAEGGSNGNRHDRKALAHQPELRYGRPWNVQSGEDCDADQCGHDHLHDQWNCDHRHRCGGFCTNPHLRQLIGSGRELHC
jgi:probable HAF family extracellular repeat protein